MSKITLSGNASGTGTLTIASPNTNSDRTLTLPDSTGTIATAESTLTQFSASGSAPVFAARAWVNFNGTGTVAIRASGNVSSITDNGTGEYTVNFTTAMPDVNYAVTGISDAQSGVRTSFIALRNPTLSVSSCSMLTYQPNSNSAVDALTVCVSVFR